MTVHRRPRAAVISTGDEVVPVTAVPKPGQVRDVNTYTLASIVREAGAEPLLMGLVPDREKALEAALARALEGADVVLISGGSSVGTRDLTVATILSFPDSEILVRGAAISPGKPTILARIGERAVWGLPGHVASAQITADLFVRPMLSRLSGEDAALVPGPRVVRARLARNTPSVHGRQDYVRVRLTHEDGLPTAHPLLGKSGLISTLVKADGLLVIGLNEEGLPRGTEVEVRLFD